MKSIRDIGREYLNIYERNTNDIKAYELLEKKNDARVKDLDEIIRANTEKEIQLLEEIKKRVRILKVPAHKQVMYYRYIERFDWNDVCHIMFSSQEDYDIEIDKYKRKMFRYHKKAINYIDNNYKDEA